MKNKIVIIDDFSSSKDLSHGKRCIQIIKEINPNINIKKIDIEFSKGRTSINKLSKALNWCVKNSVKLINLSLGTINYYDSLVLDEQIHQLIKQGCIIVSAFHNANIMSWPAAFFGVFGVIQDRYSLLKNGEFCFVSPQKCNVIVAHYYNEKWDEYSNNLGIKESNSFAAPVITGVISRYIDNKRNYTHEDIVKFLIENSKNNILYPDTIQKYPLYCRKSQIPNIGIISCGEWYKELIFKFQKEGYSVELFEENETDYIPLYIYSSNKKITDKLICGLEYIYQSNIFIFLLTKRYYKEYNQDNTFDIFIEKKKFFLVSTREETVYCNDINTLYQKIKKYFS